MRCKTVPIFLLAIRASMHVTVLLPLFRREPELQPANCPPSLKKKQLTIDHTVELQPLKLALVRMKAHCDHFASTMSATRSLAGHPT